MIIRYETAGSINGLETIIHDVLTHSAITGLLILSCDNNQFTADRINPVLKKINVPVLGGIFPSIVYGNELWNNGSIVLGLTNLKEVHLIDQLSNDQLNYEDILDKKIPDMGDSKTMMVFVDGFAKRISSFIEGLFSVFGLDINYIGGGAGSLSMKQKPCLFSNQGLVEDCAVIGLLNAHSGVGVSHGWTVLNGPYRVTESDHNTIKTLDWRPAFEVYHEVVAAHAEKSLTQDNFFEISKAYPFGIARMNNEQIVRDPILSKPDQSLVCVGEVPEGSIVSILNGDNASLIKAAGTAVQIGIASFPSHKTKETIFIIDCISRVLFLENQFKLELEAAHYGDLPLVGACSLGEIANCGNEFLEFYNKTCVVAVLEK
ncbi:MAG: FIST C-terminal domain-containing protein [Pseudomonadota bacterium]